MSDVDWTKKVFMEDAEIRRTLELYGVGPEGKLTDLVRDALKKLSEQAQPDPERELKEAIVEAAVKWMDPRREGHPEWAMVTAAVDALTAHRKPKVREWKWNRLKLVNDMSSLFVIDSVWLPEGEIPEWECRVRTNQSREV